MVQISRCVIHEIRKEARTSNAKLIASKHLNNNTDPLVQQLVEDTHKSFSEDSSLKHTSFNAGSATQFSNSLNLYFESESDVNFYQFSYKSIKELRHKLERESLAVGGYYVFVDYEYDGRRFISVMVVRKRKGLSFVKVNKVIGPSKVDVNAEKIAMGFRLNHSIYSSPGKDKNYIALVTSQQDKIVATYFKDWVNAAGIINNEKNSRALVQLLKVVVLPINEDGSEPYPDRDALNKAVYEYGVNAGKGAVNLNDLSAYLYGEDGRDYLRNTAALYEIEIDNEFKKSTRVWRKLIMIKAKVEGIELSVEFTKINTNEVEVKPDRIIIYSQDLADQIRVQQKEALATEEE